MPHITIISASVREGRKSHRVAIFLNNYIKDNNLASSEILDLNEYQFPVFNERLSLQADPPDEVLHFATKIKNADGIIIVTPEYNGGYPASLKNITDLLYDEWYRKPLAISTVSDGPFGGAQVLTSLLFTLWKMKAWVIPAIFPNPRVDEAFNENGVPKNKIEMEKRAGIFLNELLWCIEAGRRMS